MKLLQRAVEKVYVCAVGTGVFFTFITLIILRVHNTLYTPFLPQYYTIITPVQKVYFNTL